MAEKLTLAYAHSLMPYPTTWHVAAAYLAWCPCHGAEAMQQLLSQLPIQVRHTMLETSLSQYSKSHEFCSEVHVAMLS